MGITREEVLKIAQVAHISLTEQELDAFTIDIEQMVDFAKALDEIEEIHTEGVGPKEEQPKVYNVFRKDEVQPSMAKEELLFNAPQEKNGCFFVPQIVE